MQKLLIRIILMIIALTSAIIPTMATWSRKTNLNIINTYENNNVTNTRWIQNNNLKIQFENNTIINIIDVKTNTNLLKPNETIIFNNCEDLKDISSLSNSITFTNNDDLYLTCTIVDTNINIKSNCCKEVLFITNKNDNNSISLGLYKDQHTIMQRVKENDIKPIYDNKSKQITNNKKTSLCNINENIKDIPNDKKAKYHMISHDGYIYKESLQSIFMIKPNDEFSFITLLKCKNNHIHQYISSNVAFENMNITCLLNNYYTLKSHNALNLRDYGYVSLISRRLSNFLEYLISISSKPIYGFMLYMIINMAVITLSMFIEYKNKKKMALVQSQISELHADSFLSNEVKQLKQQEIENANRGSTMSVILGGIIQFLPSILQICNTWYVIPYCYALQNINILWFTLGLPDLYILIPYINLSPIMIIALCIMTIKVVNMWSESAAANTINNDNNGDSTQNNQNISSIFTNQDSTALVMEFVLLFWIFRSGVNSVANIILIIITLLLKDIVKYIGEKVGL